MDAVTALTKTNPLTGVSAVAEPGQQLNASADLLAKAQAGLLAGSSIIKKANNQAGAVANVSMTAHLIAESLRQATAAGFTEVYQARQVLSATPNLPVQMAKALERTINNSGLFYESHLKHFAAGQRSLDSILQEPQNSVPGQMPQSQTQAQNQSLSQPALNALAQALLPQQLAILEHQRLSWQGEVWPNQQMFWQIDLPRERENSQPHSSTVESPTAINSDLTLHLPRLGKVTAKLQLNDGRVRISVSTESGQTLAVLKAQSHHLLDAMKDSGQKVEALTVMQHD